MSNHEHPCRGCGEDLRKRGVTHEANCLASRLDSTAKLVTQQAKERHELECRLDALSKAVRGAWDANRKGDMFKSLGAAMDIVDPSRNEQPIRAVEKHAPFVSARPEADGKDG